VHSVWIGAVMLAVLGGAIEGPTAAARLTGPELLAVAYLVLVTVAAFVLWYSAVSALGPGRVGLLTGIAPVSAALAGVAAGSRAPTALMWAGIAVVLAGLGAGLREDRRPPWRDLAGGGQAGSADGVAAGATAARGRLG
jgi:drug/metabolite transporter (DMT)-like permease